MGRRARVGLALLATGLAVAGLLARSLLRHPPLELHAGVALPVAGPDEGGVRARWMGCATLLLDDGQTRLLFDGFFSRPGKLRVAFTRIAPDEARIEAALARAGIERLDAVLTAHSHYDHAMDAPRVAARTGALLVGSASTARIAQGLDFPGERVRVVEGGERLTLGRFTVTVFAVPHTPGGPEFAGEIREALRPPARAWAWREGGCRAWLVEHGGRGILVHASTSFTPGLFASVRAEAAFLGTASLGRLGTEHAREWWRETAQAVGARVVIPIHWDDFTLPLDEPLRPMPPLMDDFGRSMELLAGLARPDGVQLGRLPLFDPVLVLGPTPSDPGR
jgi:L-ascorbate metabolism protein UlaG (beta-lactamase superfamily)